MIMIDVGVVVNEGERDVGDVDDGNGENCSGDNRDQHRV